MAKKADFVEAEVVSENSKDYQESGYYRYGGRGGLFWGLLLVGIGGILIAQTFINVNFWQYFWPAVLVVFGLSLIIRSFR